MAEYDVRKAFAKIENELIESMIRNMKRHRAEEKEEGFQWEQWQAVQLRALDEYRNKHRKELGERYTLINQKMKAAILEAKAQGGMAQERKILRAIKEGLHMRKPSEKMVGEFFTTNERKMDALLDAVQNDMEKAEYAILRKHDDEYRKAIFDAQVYANSGAGTYEKAVDMAVRDYVSNGINCVTYSNGRRVNIKDYADMALRTAGKRAYLAGEGQKRQEWGIHTVIMNKRGNPCPKCLPWVGRVLVDDVWSGGTAEEGSEMGYPLMSQAMAAGLYHPNCRDSHTTYFEGISTPPSQKWKREELEEIERKYGAEQKKNHARRQAEKYGRLEKNALDESNRKAYNARKEEWMERCGGDMAGQVSNAGILGMAYVAKEVIEVHTVGKIDRDIYKCVTEDIVTDEVIITDERIQHIKDRHPDDYERFCGYIPDIIADPDYIIRANKPNTAVILKEVIKDGEKFQLVLRILTPVDNPDFKNSVITFLNINERTWNKYLRNKEILYKKE